MQKNLLSIKKHGFTLIELLVVIAIIGILASVILASLDDSKKAANDAVRVSDMRAITTALELFFNEHGHYPGSTYEGVDGNGEMIGDDNGPIENALRPYLTNIPQDPKHDGVVYFYSYDPVHCIDSPPSCECIGSTKRGVALAFNKAEISTGFHKDTCSGPHMNIDNADFNRIFTPQSP